MGTDRFNGLEKKSYEVIRGTIKAGDILFCKGEYGISKAIRKVSGSDFSHVAFVFPWNDRIMVIESVEDDGVRAVPLSHYLNNYENSGEAYNGSLYLGRVNQEIEESDVKTILGRAADLLNRKYDKEAIFKIAVRVITGLGRDKANDEYICSEFVDVCFQDIGITFQRDPKGFIFPEHIAADPKVEPLFEVMP